MLGAAIPGRAVRLQISVPAGADPAQTITEIVKTAVALAVIRKEPVDLGKAIRLTFLTSAQDVSLGDPDDDSQKLTIAIADMPNHIPLYGPGWRNWRASAAALGVAEVLIELTE